MTLAIVASFLVVSKVHSPQYALWVLPLLALVDVPWWQVAGYFAADIVLFVSGFYWFTEGMPTRSGWIHLFVVSVFVRALFLGAIAVTAAVWGRRRFPSSPSPDSAEPNCADLALVARHTE